MYVPFESSIPDPLSLCTTLMISKEDDLNPSLFAELGSSYRMRGAAQRCG